MKKRIVSVWVFVSVLVSGDVHADALRFFVGSYSLRSVDRIQAPTKTLTAWHEQPSCGAKQAQWYAFRVETDDRGLKVKGVFTGLKWSVTYDGPATEIMYDAFGLPDGFRQVVKLELLLAEQQYGGSRIVTHRVTIVRDGRDYRIYATSRGHEKTVEVCADTIRGPALNM